MRTQLLGLDPGFASIGYALIDVHDEQRVEIVKFGVIQTEKSSKKQNTFASEDNVRRTIEIYATLEEIATRDTLAICAESMSFPRNASTAAKMAMCWGALSAFSHVHRIAILQNSPQAIKLAICGRKDASKIDMTRAIVTRFPALAERIVELPRDDREHPIDGLSAALVCMQSDLVKMVLRRTA